MICILCNLKRYNFNKGKMIVIFQKNILLYAICEWNIGVFFSLYTSFISDICYDSKDNY